MTMPSARVGYIPTVPLKVDSDNEAESSAGEEQTKEFPKEYFKNPHEHFRMHPKDAVARRGMVSSQDVAPLMPSDGARSLALTETLSKIEEIQRQFKEESFGRTATESHEVQSERLHLVVGLNKMRSISASRNRSLREAVSVVTTDPNVSMVGFFWSGVYQEREVGSKTWKNCSFDRVKKFYRQFKKKNRQAAKKFQKSLEKSRGHLVPYRGLRERLSQSKETKEAVRTLREDKQVSKLFLGMFDADSLSLHAPDGRGVFTHYDEMVAKHPRLEMGSCGYLFTGQKTIDSPEDAIMKVASEADLRIRHATAKFFAYGVYYPEPNSIIRIRDGNLTIEYSFETGEEHYASPQESIIILDQIRKKFQGDPQVVVFEGTGAIPTVTPDRAEKPFAAHYNDYKKIVRWTERDLMRMRGVSQSNLHPKKWVDNLLRDLDIEETEIEIESGETVKLSEQSAKRVVISLISRLFNHYNVISMAQDRLEEQRKKNPNAAFPTELIAILKRYEPERMPFKRVERKPVEVETATTKLWKIFDSIESLEDLRDSLELFLPADDVEKVEAAARESGKVVLKLFQERFETSSEELTLSMMRDFLRDVNPQYQERLESYQPTESARQILKSNALTVNETLGAPFRTLLKNERAKKDPFSLLPMHWAAMYGDRHLIKKLKTLKGEDAKFASIDEVAVQQITPLHCALRYMADNAADTALMQELLDANTANAVTTSGRRPLIMALEEIESPLSIVELLFRYPVLSEENQRPLLEILKKLHPAQLRESILTSLLLHLPDEELGLVRELLGLGLRADSTGYALTDDDIEELKDVLQTVNIGSLTGVSTADPLPLAVRRGNVDLVRALIDAGAKVTECYDEEGHTPIMVAILHLKDPYPMLKLLIKNGASVLELNQGNTPPPLRYLVDQKPQNKLLLYFLLGKANKEEGFAEFFFETGDAGYGGLIEDFLGTKLAESLIAEHVDNPSLEKGTRAILRAMAGDADGIDESSSDSDDVSGSELSEDSSSHMEGESELSDESSNVSDDSLPSSGDEQE